ncbi:MAG: hypothetical protein ACFFDN_25415 [Candidatus Hodarchaeota archaeon]
MKEITEILTDFSAILRDDVLDYYEKCYSYLKDLIAYKNIDLNKKTEPESENRLKNTLEKMLKAIKTGLNTIGVSMDKLNENQKDFLNSISYERTEFPDYNTYFKIFLQNYVDKILFEILIEYLVDIDTEKLENANLFNLVPPYLVSKLNDFKNKYFNDASTIEMFRQQNYVNYINFTDLTIKSSSVEEPDILTQLREAKQDIIETLKTPKKELLKMSISSLGVERTFKEEPSRTKREDQGSRTTIIDKEAKIPTQVGQDLIIETKSDTFLDYFGHFSQIQLDITSQFKIDKVNLINTKIVNQDFFDIENLYYFVCIIKMLNIEFPFTNIEILRILKNYVNGRIFSSSEKNIPDSKHIFFGLGILSELDLLNDTDIIDFFETEQFVKSDLKEFIPEKLELNLYSLLCLKIMAKRQDIKINKNSILGLLTKLNLSNLEDFNPTLDIYNHLASIRLLDKEVSLNQFKAPYINEIKKLITPNGNIDDSITASSRALLILDLLNYKEHEPELCSTLLNYILNSTNFFYTENINDIFNWRNDILAYKIELKMLYWALLAISQYASLNY